ncbi:putative ATP-dependent RNA helicase DDX56-like [Tropilaelaps mercedesae]|uniref:RNA helicase n=1 Tax=Tropilaelaps mercedesae TaxID=418985 RepID=A0A1V9Y1A7_9ACAR|nr:putative ATP-dependent RNA helicase DDX56-like [Tropilaelaps mercedesae]
MVDEEEPTLDFHEMSLDERIVKALARLGWRRPTAIQERAIPFALKGKDILAKARTGSGKTAGFAIPAIQKVLERKMAGNAQETTVLVLAPSKELCKQIHRHFVALSQCCVGLVQACDVSEFSQLSVLRPQLLERPDVVIGTPARVLAHVRAGNLLLDFIQMLQVDEADLVFAFGHEKDTEQLLKSLPNIYQAIVSSATLSEDVLALKRLVLHSPVILRLEESSLTDNPGLQQYVVKCEELDKHAILAALFKLNLIKGKTLIFVNSVDRGYRTKLFLDQFGIRSCVLNSELPLTSRQVVIDRFNEGRYDTIVASDDKSLELKSAPGKKQAGKRRAGADAEFAVSRGLDFQFVSNVINLEFPMSVEAYVHRVGRTARANRKGTALNFVAVHEMPFYEAVEAKMTAEKQNMFQPYRFKIDEIEGFRYRAQTALNQLQKRVIKEARIKDIKEEMLKSAKLKTFFEENPREHFLLRHDKAVRTKGAKTHGLKHVPDYIIPPTLQRIMQISSRKRLRPIDDTSTAEPNSEKVARKEGVTAEPMGKVLGVNKLSRHYRSEKKGLHA